MIKVLGVLNGRDMPDASLLSWARQADQVFAADGAADRLLALGIVPEVVVGDLDSVSSEALKAIPSHLVDADQNRSDCDKLLDVLGAPRATRIVVAGLEGDRLDHTLYGLQACAARPGLRLALRGRIGISVSAERMELSVTPGATVSLLPIERCTGVVLEGVKWPLVGASLEPSGLRSLSNQVSAARISVQVSSGTAILFIESMEPRWDL